MGPDTWRHVAHGAVLNASAAPMRHCTEHRRACAPIDRRSRRSTRTREQTCEECEESQERRRTIELKSRREGSDRSARTQYLGRQRKRRRSAERVGRGKGLPDRWIVRARGNVTRVLPRSSDATTACPHAVEQNANGPEPGAHSRIVRAIVTINCSHVAKPQGRLARAGAREASVNPDGSGPVRQENVEAGYGQGWFP